MRELVQGLNQVRHKPAFLATENSQRLEILYTETEFVDRTDNSVLEKIAQICYLCDAIFKIFVREEKPVLAS